MTSALFVSDGVSTDLIAGGEPRLRRHRGSDSSWFTRAAALVRGRRATAVRRAALSR